MMKKFLALFALAVALASHGATVGYYNYRFFPGDNLFQNNLNATDNKLSTIFGADTPVGTTVSLWNPASSAYGASSQYLGGGNWTVNLTLAPGTGARLSTAIGFTNTFIGEVVDRTGGSFTVGEELVPPPPFGGPNGLYLWGDKVPIASSGSTLFQYVVGRLPNDGEQIIRLNAANQIYTTSTFLGGAWDVVPSINVGEAAFFNIGPVPEPSTGALLLLGCALLRRGGRRKV